MKKQLIDLMIEEGVKWPDGAEYAAQDKNSNDLCFYRNEPCHNSRYSEEWRPSELDNPYGIVGYRVTLPSLCAKWRSTLVTREQYEQALAERRPAIDTGIDWNEAPEWADRVIKGGASNLLYWASDNTLQPVKGGASFVTSTHIRDNWEVVERRPVQPIEVHNCRFVTTSASSTIEQRIASLRALEKQVEETRAELTRDLEALGLTWMARDEPEQPTITDWRDLRVGDVIWVGESPDIPNAPSGECSITCTDFNDPSQPVQVKWSGGKTWPNLTKREWRFIRRP